MSCTYTSVSYASTGSNNGLSPIIWSNAGLLFIVPLGTNVNETWIKIQQFSYKKINSKTSSAKRLPFCLDLNALKLSITPGLLAPNLLGPLNQSLSTVSVTPATQRQTIGRTKDGQMSNQGRHYYMGKDSGSPFITIRDPFDLDPGNHQPYRVVNGPNTGAYDHVALWCIIKESRGNYSHIDQARCQALGASASSS